MNADELKIWVQHTADRFPQVSQLFERATDRKGLAESWEEVLRTIPSESATAFTAAMLSGEVEPPTYMADWAKLPAMLRRWSRDNKPLTGTLQATWTDERSFRCLACRDRGYGVEVFNPVWVNRHSTEIELRELSGEWWRDAVKWCREFGVGCLVYGCDCNCDAGRRQAELRKQPRQVYNSKLHCLVPPCGRNGWMDALCSWVTEHPALESNEWRPQIGYQEAIE